MARAAMSRVVASPRSGADPLVLHADRGARMAVVAARMLQDPAGPGVALELDAPAHQLPEPGRGLLAEDLDQPPPVDPAATDGIREVRLRRVGRVGLPDGDREAGRRDRRRPGSPGRALGHDRDPRAGRGGRDRGSQRSQPAAQDQHIGLKLADTDRHAPLLSRAVSWARASREMNRLPPLRAAPRPATILGSKIQP